MHTLELSHQRQSGNNSTTLAMSKCLEMQQNCVALLNLLFLYEEEGKTQSEKMHFLVAYLSMEKLSNELQGENSV